MLFKYILRLLAGKFETICTEFPSTTFSTKNSNFFRQKIWEHSLVQKFSPRKNFEHSILIKKKRLFSEACFLNFFFAQGDIYT